jgi:hypothetical protein
MPSLVLSSISICLPCPIKSRFPSSIHIHQLISIAAPLSP